MLKLLILVIAVTVVIVFIAVLLKKVFKFKKKSKKDQPAQEEVKQEEYVPQGAEMDLHSSNSTVMTDMSNSGSKMDNVSDTGFYDFADDEFMDYSKYARGGKRPPMPDFDFDLDGDMADDDFYMPNSPDFSYVKNLRPTTRKKEVKAELNELSTELKVLMLSDIFDRKFFD